MGEVDDPSDDELRELLADMPIYSAAEFVAKFSTGEDDQWFPGRYTVVGRFLAIAHASSEDFSLFLVEPGARLDVRRLTWHVPEMRKALWLHRPGLSRRLAEKGLSPRTGGNLLYDLPMEATGTLVISPAGGPALDDVWRVVVPQHESDSGLVDRVELFFIPP